MKPLVPTQKELEIAMKQRAIASKIRGDFLNRFADIEFMLEVAVCTYFCSGNHKKRFEMMNSLMAHQLMSFEIKQNNVGFIIKNAYPDLEKEYPTLINDIASYKELRNKIAHLKILHNENIVKAFNGKDIFFSNFATKGQEIKMKVEPMNLEKASQLDIKMYNSSKALEKLIMIMMKKVKQKRPKSPL